MGSIFLKEKYNSDLNISNCIINLLVEKPPIKEPPIREPPIRTSELNYQNIVFHIKRQWQNQKYHPLLLGDSERDFIRAFVRKYPRMLVIFGIIESKMVLQT